MRTLLDEAFAPTTSAIGFLEASLDDAADSMAAWLRGLHGGEVHAATHSAPLSHLLTLLYPITRRWRPRHLLAEGRAGWTAYFDCGLSGTDPTGTVGYLSSLLECRGLSIVVAPHRPRPRGEAPERYGAVQFELVGPGGNGPLRVVRTIAVTATGRSTWDWTIDGGLQPYEETDQYRQRKVRDRFTSEMLERYCRALGIDPFAADWYGPRGVLLTAPEPVAAEDEFSLAEVQEYFGIVPGEARALAG